VIDKRELLLAVALSVVAAIAAGSVVQFGTPVDRALPFLAVVVVLLFSSRTSDGGRQPTTDSRQPAAVGHRLSVLGIVIPLLLICEVVIADERARLLAIAIVMAVAFALSSFRAHPLVVTVLAVLVLRWIPFSDVVVWRELIVLVFAGAIALLSRNVLIAVLAALFAPTWPIKMTIVILFAVLFLCGAAASAAGRRRTIDAMVLLLVIAFFPWSGLMARGWRFFIHPPRQAERVPVRYPLRRGDSVMLDIPEQFDALIVSGANVQKMPPGTLLGTIEPHAIPIRIGDVSDWGFMRRDQFFASRNIYPRDPAGQIRDYGWKCWIDGAGRVKLPAKIGAIRISANPKLPHDAVLQVEAIEMRMP